MLGLLPAHVFLEGFACLSKVDRVPAIGQEHLIEDFLEDLVRPLLQLLFSFLHGFNRNMR